MGAEWVFKFDGFELNDAKLQNTNTEESSDVLELGGVIHHVFRSRISQTEHLR